MITASLFEQSWPLYVPRNSLNQSHQVCLHTCIITACMFAQSLPPSASAVSLDGSLQVYSQPRTILASLFPQPGHPSWLPNLLDHSLQVCLPTHMITASRVTRSRPPSASPIVLYLSLTVYRHTRSIMTAKFLPLRPPCEDQMLLDYYLGVHRQTRSITAGKVSLQASSITAVECISKFTRSRCGALLQLDGPHRIVTTLPHLAWHAVGIREHERIWYDDVGRRWDDMKGYAAMMNYTNCMDQWMHVKSLWGTTQIAWIYESSSGVQETKSWER
jgi:hypothetical protein